MIRTFSVQSAASPPSNAYIISTKQVRFYLLLINLTEETKLHLQYNLGLSAQGKRCEKWDDVNSNSDSSDLPSAFPPRDHPSKEKYSNNTFTLLQMKRQAPKLTSILTRLIITKDGGLDIHGAAGIESI